MVSFFVSRRMKENRIEDSVTKSRTRAPFCQARIWFVDRSRVSVTPPSPT